MFNKTCRWLSWGIFFISLFFNCNFAYGQETILSYDESKLALLETNSLQNLIVNSVGPHRVTIEAPSLIQGQVLLAVYDENSRFIKVVSVHSNGQSIVEFPFEETPLEAGSIVRAFYVGENWSPLAKTSGRVTIPETEERDPNTQEMATDLKITIIGNPGSIRAASDNHIITFIVDGINPYVPPFNGTNALVNVTLPNGKVVSTWQTGANSFILQLDKGTSESTEDLIAGTYTVKVMTYQNPLVGETRISEANKTNQPERTVATSFSIVDDTNDLYVCCIIGGVSNKVPVAPAQVVELTMYAPNGRTFRNVEYLLTGPLKNNLTSSNNGTLHEATYSEAVKTIDVVGGGSITVSGLVTYDDGTTAAFEKSIQVSGYVVEFTPTGLLEVGSEVELRAVVTTNTGIPVNNAKVIWTSTDLNSTSNPMFKVFNNYSKTYEPSVNSLFVDGTITNIQNGIYSKKVKLSEVGFLNCTVLNSLETVYAVNSQKVYGIEVYSLKNPVNSLIANQKNQTITLEPLDINGLPITPDWYYIDDNSAILSSVNAYMQTNKAHFSIVPCLKTGDFTILLGTDNGKKIVRIPISVVEPVVTVMVNGVESNKITAGLLEKVELYFENKAESTVTAVLSGLDGSIYQTDQITPLDAGQASVSGVNTIFTKVVPFKSFTEGFVDIYVDFNGSSIKATTLKVIQPTIMSFNSLEIGKQQEHQLYLRDANGNPLSGYCIKSLVNDANAGTLSSETDGNGNTLLSISPIAVGKITLQVPELLTKDANDLADNPNLSLISPNDLTPFSIDLPLTQYIPDTSGPDIQAADTYTISTIPTTIEFLVTDVSRLGEVLIENQLADISSDGIVKLHIDELPFGEKAFSIQAKDLIGNVSSKTVTVQYQNYPNNQVVTENLKITITGNPGSLRAASDPHLFTFTVDRIDSSVPVYIGTNMLLNVTLPNGRVVPATNVGIYQYPPQHIFTLQLDKGIDITTEDLIAGIYTVEAVTYLNPLEGESLISEANKTKQPVRKAITTFSIIDNTNVLFINGLTIGGFSGGNASKVPVGSSQVVGFTLVAPNGRTFKDVIYTVEGPLKATVTSRNLGALYGYMYGEATKTVDVIGGGIITFSGTVTYDNNSTEMFAKTLQVAGYIAEYSPATMPAVSNEVELKAVVTTTAGIPINNARVVWTSTDFYGVSNPMFRLYNNVSKTYEPYGLSSVNVDGAVTNIQNGVYSTKVKLNEVGVLTCSVMNNGAYGAIYAINSQPVYGEEVYTSNITSASITATKPNQELIIQLTDTTNNSVKPDWIYVEDPSGLSGYLPGSLQNVPTGTSMRFSPGSKTGSFTILLGTDMGKKITKISVNVVIPKVLVNVNGIESSKITAGALEKIDLFFEDKAACSVTLLKTRIDGTTYDINKIPYPWGVNTAIGATSFYARVVPFKSSEDSKIDILVSYGNGVIKVATLPVIQPMLKVNPTSLSVGSVVDLNLSLTDANGRPMKGYTVISTGSDAFAGNSIATTDTEGKAILTVSPNAVGSLTLQIPNLLTRDVDDVDNGIYDSNLSAIPLTASIPILRDTQGPVIEMSDVYLVTALPATITFKVTDYSKVAEVWIDNQKTLVRPDGTVRFTVEELEFGQNQYVILAYDLNANATEKNLIINYSLVPIEEPTDSEVAEDLKIMISGQPASIQEALDLQTITFTIDRFSPSAPAYEGANTLVNVTMPSGLVVATDRQDNYTFTLQLDKGNNASTSDLIAGDYFVEVVSYRNELDGETLISEANLLKQPMRIGKALFTVIDNPNALVINSMAIGGLSGTSNAKVSVGRGQLLTINLSAPSGRLFKNVSYTVDGPLNKPLISSNNNSFFAPTYFEATRIIDVLSGGNIIVSGSVTYDNNTTESFHRTLQVAGYMVTFLPETLPTVGNELELKAIVTTTEGIPINNAKVIWTTTDFFGEKSNTLFQVYDQTSNTFVTADGTNNSIDGATRIIQNGEYSTIVKLVEPGYLTCSVYSNEFAYSGQVFALNQKIVYGEETYSIKNGVADLIAGKPNQLLTLEIQDKDGNAVTPDWVYIEDMNFINGCLLDSFDHSITGTAKLTFSPMPRAGRFTILLGTDAGKKIVKIPVNIVIPSVTIKVNGIESNKITAGVFEKIELSFENSDRSLITAMGSGIDGSFYCLDKVTPLFGQETISGATTIYAKVVPFKSSVNSKLQLYADFGCGQVKVATLDVVQPILTASESFVTIGSVVDLSLSLSDANGKPLSGYTITSTGSDTFAGNTTATTDALGKAFFTVSPNAVGTLTLTILGLPTTDVDDVANNPGLVLQYGTTPLAISLPIQRDLQGPIIDIKSPYTISTFPTMISFKVTDYSKVAEVWIDNEKALVRPDGSVYITIDEFEGNQTQYTILAYDSYGNATEKTMIVQYSLTPVEDEPNNEITEDLVISITGLPSSIQAALDPQSITFTIERVNTNVPVFDGSNTLVNVTMPNGNVATTNQIGTNTFSLQLDKGSNVLTEDLISGTYTVQVMTYLNSLEEELFIAVANQTNQPKRTGIATFSIVDNNNVLTINNLTIGGFEGGSSSRVPVGPAQLISLTLTAPAGRIFKSFTYSVEGPLKNNLNKRTYNPYMLPVINTPLNLIDVVSGGIITFQGTATYDNDTTETFSRTLQVAGYVVEFTPTILPEVGSEVELRAVVTTSSGIPVNNAKVIWTSTDYIGSSNDYLFTVYNNNTHTFDEVDGANNSVNGATSIIQNGIFGLKVKLNGAGKVICTVISNEFAYTGQTFAVNSQVVYGKEEFSLKSDVPVLIAAKPNQEILLELLDSENNPVIPDWVYVEDSNLISGYIEGSFNTNASGVTSLKFNPGPRTADFTILLGTEMGKRIAKIPVHIGLPSLVIKVNGLESNTITAGLLEKVDLSFADTSPCTISVSNYKVDGSVYRSDRISSLQGGEQSVILGVTTLYTKLVPFRFSSDSKVDLFVNYGMIPVKVATLIIAQPNLIVNPTSVTVDAITDVNLALTDARGKPLSGYNITTTGSDSFAGNSTATTNDQGQAVIPLSPNAVGNLTLQVYNLRTRDLNDYEDNPGLSWLEGAIPLSVTIPILRDTEGPDIEVKSQYSVSTMPATISFKVFDPSSVAEVWIESEKALIRPDGYVHFVMNELELGQTQFSVIAFDTNGNFTEINLVVYYSPTPEEEEPIVSEVTDDLKITVTGQPTSIQSSTNLHDVIFSIDRLDTDSPVYDGLNTLVNFVTPSGIAVPANRVDLNTFMVQLDSGEYPLIQDIVAGTYRVEVVTYLNPLGDNFLISVENLVNQPLRRGVAEFTILDNANVLIINSLTIGGYDGSSTSKVPVGGGLLVSFDLTAPVGRVFKSYSYTVEGPLKNNLYVSNYANYLPRMDESRPVDIVGGGSITVRGTVIYDNDTSETFSKTLQVAGYIVEYSPALLPTVGSEVELSAIVTTTTGSPVNNAKVVWTSLNYPGNNSLGIFQTYNDTLSSYQPLVGVDYSVDGATTIIQNGDYRVRVKLIEVGSISCTVLSNEVASNGQPFAVNEQTIYGEETYTIKEVVPSLIATKVNQELTFEIQDSSGASVTPDWFHIEDYNFISGYVAGSFTNVVAGRTKLTFSPGSRPGTFAVLLGTDMGKKIVRIPISIVVPSATVKVNGIESNKITAGLLEKIELILEDKSPGVITTIGFKIEGGVYRPDGVSFFPWGEPANASGVTTLYLKAIPLKSSSDSRIDFFISYGNGPVRVVTLNVVQPTLLVDPTSVTVGTVVDLNLFLYDANGKAMNGYLITSTDSDVFAGNATATTGADGSATLTVSPNAIGTLTLKVPNLFTRDINDIQDNPGLLGSYDATPFTTSISIQRDTKGPIIEASSLYEINSLPSTISFKVTDISKVSEVWFDTEKALVRADGNVYIPINSLKSGLSQHVVLAYDTVGNVTEKTLAIMNNSIPMSSIQGRITRTNTSSENFINLPVTIYASGSDLYRIDTSIPEGQTQTEFELTVPVGEYILYYDTPANAQYLSQGFYHPAGTRQLRDNAERVQVTELGEGIIDLTVISLVDANIVVKMPLDLPCFNEATSFTVFAVGEKTYSYEGLISEGLTEHTLIMSLPSGQYVFYVIVNTGSDKLMPYSIYSTTGMKTQANQASLIDIQPGHLGLTFTLLTKPTISGLVSLPAGKFVQGMSDLAIKVSASTNNAALDLSALNTNSQVGPALQMVSSSNLVTTNVNIPLGSNAVEYTLSVAPGDYFVGYQIINQQSEFLGKGFYSYLGVTNAATCWMMIQDQENTVVSMQIPNAGFSDQNTYGVNKSMLETQNDLVKAGVQDVSPSDWYAGSFTVLINNGLMSPDEQGSILPNASVTAAEGISIFAKLFGLANFNDSPSVAFSKTVQSGLVPSTLLEDQMLTRLDLARFLKLVLGMTSEPTSFTKSLFRDVSTLSEDEIGILNAVYESRLFVGFGRDNFRPSDVVTKAEIAVLVDRILSG